MARIVAAAGAQISATQILRALHDEATSLAQLAPMHETLVQTAQRQRRAAVIADSGLPPNTSRTWRLHPRTAC